MCDDNWLTLSLPSEPREFQASPLLPPAPSQVPQHLGRAASLLEQHTVQLCQHVNRDCPGDEDRMRWASRVPSQVPPVFSSSPRGSWFWWLLFVLCISFPPILSLSSLLLCVHLPDSLPERMDKKDRTKASPSCLLFCSEKWGCGVMTLCDFDLGLLRVFPVGTVPEPVSLSVSAFVSDPPGV